MLGRDMGMKLESGGLTHDMNVPSQRECSTLLPKTPPLVTTSDIGLSNHL